MIVGDIVKVKSKNTTGLLCSLPTSFISFFNGAVIKGESFATIKVLEDDGSLLTLCIRSDDLEEIE